MPHLVHERKICSLVAGLLFQRRNEIMTNYSYPEDEKPPILEAVDAVYSTNGGNYVFEHTTIESYPSQITEDYKVNKLLGSIKNKLANRIKEKGCYKITFATEVLKDKNICAKLADCLIDWVSKNAGKLEIGSPRTAPRHVISDMLSLGGNLLEVSLYRWPYNGIKVEVSRSSPKDVSEKLLSQVKASLEKKLPKLLRWAKNRNAAPILIFETIDHALVHGANIADAVLEIIQNYAEQPEVICIVGTQDGFCQVWECNRPFGDNNVTNIGLFPLSVDSP